jgi:hypothetical protein
MVPQENLKFQKESLSQARKDAQTAADYELAGEGVQLTGSIIGGRYS